MVKILYVNWIIVLKITFFSMFQKNEERNIFGMSQEHIHLDYLLKIKLNTLVCLKNWGNMARVSSLKGMK